MTLGPPARARRAVVCVVASAIALSGCGPQVLWRARSLDLRHVVEVVSEAGRERVVVDGAPAELFDAVASGSVAFTPGGAAHYVVRAGSEWRVVGPEAPLVPFLEVELPLRVVDGALLFSAADRDGWHLVRGAEVGTAFDAAATEIRIAPRGRIVYVARSSASERVVIDGAAGPPFDDVRLVALGGRGEHVVYSARLGTGEHVVVGGAVGPAVEEVLELCAATDAHAHAAIVGHGEICELVHVPPVVPNGGGAATPVALGSAALLTHLRISDDGAHVACLSPARDGLSIEVWLDGVSIARHRRVEGERLAFVPGEHRLVWLAEDAQGLVVRVDGVDGVDGVASDRFETVEGPLVTRGRSGFIGRRAGRSEVWVDGVRVADEPLATELRLGAGGHHAFVARTDEQRFVVTRRGRWPVPMFFVDTLVLDASGEHWAALVPDAAERRLSVWIDGEPAVTVPAEDVLGPAVAAGVDPTTVLLATVEAVLEEELAR